MQKATPMQKKSRTKQKIIVGAIVVAMGTTFYTPVYSACCDCAGSLGKIIATAAAKIAATVAAQAAAASAISIASFINSERIMSAYATLTKQEALVAQSVSETAVDAQNRYADAVAAIEAQRRTTQAAVQHSAEFGQGFQPCRVLAKQEQIAAAMADMPNRVRRDVTKMSAAPGRKAPREQEREAIRADNKFYCCNDWDDVGMCTPPDNKELQCASINAGTMLKSCKEGDDMCNAKQAFINNLTGPATLATTEKASKSLEGQSLDRAKLTVDARYSPAMVSLAAIKADSTARSDGEAGDPDGLSLDERFEQEALRYMGAGKDSLEWSRVMAQQEEHGLLIELLRAKALDLALMERQYRQYERIEAVLAGLTAQAGQSAADETERLARKANIEVQQ